VGHVGTRPHRQTPRQRRLRLISDRFRTNDFFSFYTPTEVGKVYSQSKIVINTSIAGDVNMRVFEGAACGALVLTDSIDNGLGELFEIGGEIATYSSDSHMLEQLRYYLAHDAEREQIAQAGHRRAVTDHLYSQRAVSLLDRVFAPGCERLAPLRSAMEYERWKARREVLTHLHALDTMLDEARSAGFGPLRRFWTIIPCLARRLLI
jgi:hypothetical protein